MSDEKCMKTAIKKSKKINLISSNSDLPFFAAGYGFSTEFFDLLLCQSMFTPHLLSLTEELLYINDNVQYLGEDDESDEKDSSLDQIKLPPPFVGRQFGDLFSYLLTFEHVIAV